MLNRKTIVAITLSSMMAVAMGTIAANQSVFATENTKIETPFDLNNVVQEDVSLLLEQINGSNQVKLSLELNEEYTNNITSLDLRIQLEPSKVKNVSMMNDSVSTSTQFRYTYDATTGILRIILVDSNDLIENRKITLGTLTLISEQTTEVTTSIQLDELKTVDLLHNINTPTVNRTEYILVYTPSDAPNDTPSDTPDNTPGDTPDNTPGDTPDDNPSDTPSDTPDNTPDEPEQPTVPEEIEVTSIKLNKTTKTLKVGDTFQLTAKVLPANATNSTLKWTSSDKSIAKVSKNGKITAVGKGTATITATSTDGSKVVATATIKVKNVKVTSVKLSKSSATLAVKDTLKLKATIQPANATNQNLVWTSSNKKVATVSSNGKVTAVAKGTATIKATTKDGSKIVATCKITVKNVKVKSVKLSQSSATLLPKETLKLKATIQPANATNQNLVWTSSNKKVATVSSSGKVKAKATGTTTITATTKDGSKIVATCKITVSTLKLNISKTSIKVGKTLTLVPEVYGKNQTVTFSSSNTKVATVTKKGKIRAKAKGTAVITVKANGVTSKVKITVK